MVIYNSESRDPKLKNKFGGNSGNIITSLNSNGKANENFSENYFLTILFPEMINSKKIPEKKLPNISDEGLFICQIFLPCWLYHLETPAGLLRKSRLGNLDALDKLLRIDKTVIADKRIARHIATHGLFPNSKEYKKLLAAMRGTPRKIQPRKIKASLAAFLHALAQHVGQPLTYPEIQALFDQSAKERGFGEIDTDFKTPDAFEKAVRRNLRFWESLLTGQNKV